MSTFIHRYNVLVLRRQGNEIRADFIPEASPLICSNGKNFTGQQYLKMDDGLVFKPNDLYPLTREEFRLYYTSQSADRQTIDVYIEDNFGKVQQLTFAFNNRKAEEERWDNQH